MNIAIIGAGKICSWFLNDIKNSKYQSDIFVKGIYTRTIEKAYVYQEKYQIENVYQTLQEAVADQTIDFYYVGTSDDSHFEIVKLLLENKKNVFCEKPLALTYQEAKSLYQIAQANKVLLFEGLKSGFSKAYQAMKKEINEGIIGEIQYINTSHIKVSSSGNPQNPPKDQKVAGFQLAGAMYELFIALDLAGSAKTIHYLNNSYPNNSAIATCSLNIRHQSNVITNCVGSDVLSNDLTTMICGTKGYIKLGGWLEKYNVAYKKDNCHMAYTYRIYNLKNELIKEQDYAFTTDGEGLCLEIDHVYELVKNKQITSNIFPPKLSLEIIKILELTNKVNDYEVIKMDEHYN